MQTRFRNTISILAILAASGAAPALAQDLDIGEVVVTANKTPTEKSKVGSTVTVVTKKDIDQQSLPMVTDYLNQVPGVTYSAPGSMGQEGSLSIRGLPKRYIKTLYNGIDISDPTSTQVQTSYQYLLGGVIGNIEVLKGSQSTLYGSDAIAGVVSVTTLGEDIGSGVHQYVFGEGGSFGTAQAGYGLTAANSTAKIGLDVTGLHTNGISLAADGTERDGYNNVTADLNGEYQFSDNFSVFASGIYIRGRAEFDNDFPISDNLTAVNRNEQIAGRLGFNLNLMDDRLKNTFSIQGMDVNREIDGTSFDGRYVGHRRRADYQGSFAATDWLLLQYGADYEKQSIDVPGAKANFFNTGLWTQVTLEPLDNLVFTAGLRHDEHSAFGGHTTYRATGSYLVEETGTRFHASVGSGFRAPSLNELYGPFGANPDLRPETSMSIDAGIEQHFFNDRVVADVTFFNLNVDNLINYVCPDPSVDPFCLSGGYMQTPGTTRSYGVESSVYWHANSWLDLNAAYTYTYSRLPDGERNIRVPRHQFGFGFTAQPWEKWALSSYANVVLDTVDTGGVELDDYVLLDAKISYKPTEATEIYVRGENLLNQKYEVVKGYGTPRLGVFAGFKATF